MSILRAPLTVTSNRISWMNSRKPSRLHQMRSEVRTIAPESRPCVTDSGKGMDRTGRFVRELRVNSSAKG